jgi:hypothetical protein
MDMARDKGHTAIVKLLEVSWFAVVGDQRGCRVSSLACAFRGELRRSGVTQVAAVQKAPEVEATRMEVNLAPVGLTLWMWVVDVDRGVVWDDMHSRAH